MVLGGSVEVWGEQTKALYKFQGFPDTPGVIVGGSHSHSTLTFLIGLLLLIFSQ